MAISVCMATFNGAAYLREQLASVLCQLTPQDELIVSDDGSQDGTTDILKSYGVRFLNGPRRGVSANFANALSAARGDYVFLADQDDTWERTKVAIQSRYLESYDLVVSDATVVENGRLRDSYFAINKSGPGLARNFLRCSFLGCCMAFRKSLLSIALPIPSGVHHDWWLGMVATMHGSVRFIPESLVNYRRHGANASPAAGVSQRSLLTKLSDRARLGLALIRS